MVTSDPPISALDSAKRVVLSSSFTFFFKCVVPLFFLSFGLFMLVAPAWLPGASAEYYLDEELFRKVEANEPLLTFGERCLLFETNMITEPYQLKDFIFKITSLGYKPVLAHPERYAYMTREKAEDLRDRGILFQLNMLSIIGYYSKSIQRTAQWLIDMGWVDLLGSDCHVLEHARLIEHVQKSKYFQKALALPLLNNTL